MKAINVKDQFVMTWIVI